jgi:ectoine hydroxylase
VYLSLCAVSNHITRFHRPEWIAHRNFTPIETLPDDCLLRDDVRALPWPGEIETVEPETGEVVAPDARREHRAA